MKSGVLGHLSPRPNGQRAEGCRLETLARSHSLHVQRCAHCNTLSLHFGPLTLRFDAESVESVWNTLGQALLVLHARREQEHVHSELESNRN
ncbi:MAG: hypothetical protein QM778_24125 [Myxococcales bacterium]